MVGGMISATVLTLVVIPAIYLVWRRFQVAREAEAVAVEADSRRGVSGRGPPT
jgi:Cu(I)/Ag(I) efflux system membrane protein CusA/SilA